MKFRPPRPLLSETFYPLRSPAVERSLTKILDLRLLLTWCQHFSHLVWHELVEMKEMAELCFFVSHLHLILGPQITADYTVSRIVSRELFCVVLNTSDQKIIYLYTLIYCIASPPLLQSVFFYCFIVLLILLHRSRARKCKLGPLKLDFKVT